MTDRRLLARAARTLRRRALAVSLLVAALAGPLLVAAPESSAAPTRHTPRPALHVASITPSGGAVAGAAPVIVRFSRALPGLAGVRKPTISPALAGHWSQPNPETLAFHATSAQLPLTKVTVTVPAATRDAAGVTLGHPVTHGFTVRDGSATRLAQLLAQLRFLPLHYRGAGRQPAAGDGAAQRRAAFAPAPGALSFGPGWPASLHDQYRTDRAIVLQGAVMAFESQHGLAIDGVAGPQVWSALIAARLHRTMNAAGYTYAYATESSPESLTVYHDGRVVEHTLANTGATGTGTQTGTYPVYERLRSQVMKGTNPDGSHYADPVQFVAYFHGGDAVHYIARADYGIPQSLGCVELPYTAAEKVWPYLTYGSLVTVAP